MSISQPRLSLHQLAQRYATKQIDRNVYRQQRKQRLEQLAEAVPPEEATSPAKALSPSKTISSSKAISPRLNPSSDMSAPVHKKSKLKWLWILLAFIILMLIG